MSEKVAALGEIGVAQKGQLDLMGEKRVELEKFTDEVQVKIKEQSEARDRLLNSEIGRRMDQAKEASRDLIASSIKEQLGAIEKRFKGAHEKSSAGFVEQLTQQKLEFNDLFRDHLKENHLDGDFEDRIVNVINRQRGSGRPPLLLSDPLEPEP